jgi:uncharacterized SAM-binding protein YcdF (DUF218 family)
VVPYCADVTTPRDAALVLGAGVNKDGSLSADTAVRVDAAVALYERGLVQRVHLSGGGMVGGVTIGERMGERARQQGLPEAAVTWEGQSQSTLQNALFSLPMLPAEDRLIVVTEPYHALRGAASLAWAGRPAAACGSARGLQGGHDWLRDNLRESAAWGLNILRGGAYLLAAALGQTARLPGWVLA